jgi:hypothetical protein
LAGCLCDNQGNPLWNDPGGDQLCYKALPLYQSIIQKRKEMSEEDNLITDLRRRILEEENQPIPITNEHELAHLYLGENFNRFSVCDISQLDLDSLLTIMGKASCFSTSIRAQAAKVKAHVMNSWMRIAIEEWSPEKTTLAFSEMKSLAESKPFHDRLAEAQGGREADHPLKEALLSIRCYRESIRNGQHEKIEEKLGRLRNIHGKEVFVRRKYREMASGSVTPTIGNVLSPNQVTLLQGAAGAGKSSVAVKALKRWSMLEEMKGATCCLFLSAGSEEKIPMYKMVWDEHSEPLLWPDIQLRDIFQCLQELAQVGRLSIWIDGLDELGYMSQRDIANASRAAADPEMKVDIKTFCVGVLSQKILPGARVIGTGRNTSNVNQELLKNKAVMYELVEMDDSDRSAMIEGEVGKWQIQEGRSEDVEAVKRISQQWCDRYGHPQ